jgi:hypothetical protein
MGGKRTNSEGSCPVTGKGSEEAVQWDIKKKGGNSERNKN